ncbi:hypothetical protein [Parasphingorhabdus sp.]|uniref:hypothetical protein n=1 Tax=Parasphingorhabdus sp. TaxID=2709688 RepID=UPI003A8D8DF9
MLNDKQNFPATDNFDGLWNTLNELQMSVSDVQSLSELCHLFIMERDLSEEQKAALSQAISDKALVSWKLTSDAFKGLSDLREEIRKSQEAKAEPSARAVRPDPQKTAGEIAQAQSHLMQVRTAINSIIQLADTDESELSFQITMLAELVKVENLSAEEQLAALETSLFSLNQDEKSEVAVEPKQQTTFIENRIAKIEKRGQGTGRGKP